MVRVLPDVAALDEGFDYSVPKRWSGSVGLGTRVRVRLHGRPVGGWVVALDVDPPPGVVVRPLSAVSGVGPPPSVFSTARWAGRRWAGPVPPLLRVASPPANVHRLPEPVPPARAVVRGSPSGVSASWERALEEAAATVARSGPPGPPVLLRLPPTLDLLGLVLAVARRAAASGRPGGLLVLVPGVGWAERLTARLRRRGLPVAGSWQEAAAGWPVVTGARAAAWAPLPALSAALVLDAHDQAYRSSWPPYAADEVVAERARRDGAPCALVSACPTVVQVARTRPWAPGRALESAGWPALAVVDRRGADPRTGLLSGELVALARRVLEAGQTMVCVLNRTGRARLLACAACGELARCERCGRPVREREGHLACAACGLERPMVCAGCGGTRLKVLRAGVARVREELEALLGVPAAEVSGAPGRTGSLPTAPLLVGTEAVLHRVRRAGAVAFLDFDQHLLAPRFTAAEESLALLARAGRLVGPRSPPGPTPGPRPLLVQTRLPDHEVLVAAVRGHPDLLAEAELPLRQQLSLPPAAALAVLAGDGAEAYAAGLRARSAGAPPRPGGLAVTQLAGDRWLVRAGDTETLVSALAGVPRPGAPLKVTVDPVDV